MKTKTMSLCAFLVVTACAASAEEEVETAIRERLAERGTVLEVDVTHEDDDRMTGFAVLRNRAGMEVRMSCTVEREGEKSLMNEGFSWRCQPA